jgi:predicted ATPase with chaperone activity
MNPCPCGYLTDPVRACRCGTLDIERYQAKVSGPLLDRIIADLDARDLITDADLAEAVQYRSLDRRLNC